MFEWIGCVAQAVMNKGVRGVAELVPGGAAALDVAGDAARLHRERRRAAGLRDEVVRLAADGAARAAEVAREAAGRPPVEERITLEVEPAAELPLAEELPPLAPKRPAARPVFMSGPLEGGDLFPAVRKSQSQRQS